MKKNKKSNQRNCDVFQLFPPIIDAVRTTMKLPNQHEFLQKNHLHCDVFQFFHGEEMKKIKIKSEKL